MNDFAFKRPHLAHAYCDSLEGKGIANARSGLFLAGPRRVGKSTFLIDDLIPEAKNRGWVPVYVDLWANKNANPEQLIAEAIKTNILNYEGKITKLAKSVKLNKINIMGALVLDLSHPGLPENITLTDALHMLCELSEKPILLIIDEAQHALMTSNGLNAMFAIKSARDQLNTNDKATSLMLVFTGSNRDKLGHLIFKKDQPFFGSDITTFPLLNQDFTDAFAEWANKSLADDNHFLPDSLWRAFQLIGHRPEILRQVAGRVAISGEAGHFSELVEQDALLWHGRIWEEFEQGFNALTVLQQTILEILITQGRSWSPFSEDSMQTYKKIIGQQDISTTAVQTAIQTLRERDFIWQSGRGAYALEDDGFAEWFKYYKQRS
ncbi:MAG: hypothetical protein NTW08_02035 [Gammaproteobacteria bacterium]|nr:hypothetical protein [Gammaproteobacteria bacterium]